MIPRLHGSAPSPPAGRPRPGVTLAASRVPEDAVRLGPQAPAGPTTGRGAWWAALASVPLLGPCLAGFLESSPGDERLRSVLDGMANRPLEGSESRVLMRAARRLGLPGMERLAAAGVHLDLGSGSRFEERFPLSAVYYPSTKTVAIGSQRLSVDTVIHELGHALDDAAAPDAPGRPVLRSEGDARLHELYRDYCHRVDEAPAWQRWLQRGAVWSNYATESVQEYLAEGIMQARCSQRSARRLEECDPALWGYVRDFLASGS